MSLKKTYSNLVPAEDEKKEKPTKLTVLDQKDENTIYNLLFEEKSESEAEGTSVKKRG